MPPITPEQRTLRARLAAYTLHLQVDGTKHTQKARDAFNQRFYDEVDPHRRLTEVERERRASLARKAYYARLSLKASMARRAKARGAAP